MTDRLTQLQDFVNDQAEHFCNAIGIIQQTALPSKFPNYDRTGSQTPVQTQESTEGYPLLFAQLVARCAKDIDYLIDALPTDESSVELQIQSLERLESENQESAEDLKEIINEGELLLQKIQVALDDIAEAQLKVHFTEKDE